MRLRGLAAHCSFKHLEDALLDKFVMGMSAGPEREKLFGMDIDDLSLAKAVDQAESVRCARTAAAASAPAGSGCGPLFKMDGGPRPTTTGAATSEKCAVCGRKNHKTSECRFANYKCKKCNNRGHLRKMCKKMNYVGLCDTSEGDDGELFNIRSHNGAPMLESVTIRDQQLKFEIDSGSSVTAISDATYYANFSDWPLQKSNKKLISYSGTKINCLGFISLPITYSNKTIDLDVHVVEKGGPPILGRDFITRFELELSPIQYCDQDISKDIRPQT